VHHIYTTPSIILKREPLDMSASYLILTRDLGLIRARAQGIRSAQSRLKGALQEFSYSTVAYVRTKAGWKITTAIPEQNFYTISENKEVVKIMARIANTLIRLIVGEEKSPEVFTAVEKGFMLLSHTAHDASAVESIIVLRILHALGYIASDTDTEVVLTDFSDYSATVLNIARNQRASIIKAINRGLQESQL
jgi:DNA repair protein RecO